MSYHVVWLAGAVWRQALLSQSDHLSLHVHIYNNVPTVSQDSTFEFEKRRNTPVRYDRELMGATIRAMKRVSEIQEARGERFYKNRMAGKKALEKAQHAIEIAQNIDLVKPAAVRKTEEVNVAEKVKAKAKNARMETE